MIPEAQRGALLWQPEQIGLSVKGAPLEVYLPQGAGCEGLIFAGIHAVLSAALRTVPQQALRWAVVLCVMDSNQRHRPLKGMGV